MPPGVSRTGNAAGGGALGIGYVVQRDDDGYFDVALDRFESETAAVYRVIVYVALMTDRSPPFHLDQGGDEPS